MKKIFLILLFTTTTLSAVFSQKRGSDVFVYRSGQPIRDVYSMPQLKGYLTLLCDFHVHTVFSDGNLWPSERVLEAWKRGLDAVAITDHIEYLPHKKHVKGDFNTSFNIAEITGKELGIIVIKGIEITRKKPLGHLNALFINDAVPIDKEDESDAINEALKQNAYIQWNHPGWPDNDCKMYPIHEQLIKDKKIHAVEVCNGYSIYPRSIDWCNQHNLTITGNTDIHGTLLNSYGGGYGTFPMTLVFASERSEKGIREALESGRTAVYYYQGLIAKEPLLKELFLSSIECRLIDKNEKRSRYEITNNTDIKYVLKQDARKIITLYPRKTTAVNIQNDKTHDLFEVTNCWIGDMKFLKTTLPL